LNTVKSEIGKVLLDQESGVILIIDTPEKIKDMEKTLDAMERKSVIRVFNLKYARAKDVEEQLKSQLDTKKVGSVKADERTNQVIIQTLPDRMEDISKLITSLDQKTRQILLDAKIIQVKLTDGLSSGVEWEGLFNIGNSKNGLNYLGSYPFSSVSGSTDDWRSRSQVLTDMAGNIGSYPFSGTTSNYAAGKQSIGTQEMHLGVINGKQDFDTVIKYLQTLGETKILSNPKLAVVNNQEAKIHVGERQAYITTTTTQTQTSNTVSESVTYVDVGIQMFVTPTINADGFVTVKIKPEISSVIDYLSTSSGNKIPIIDTSTAETIVMVKDGTSILIGGLSKEEKTSSSEETPFLSKIPLLGEAFKSKTKKSTRSELVILITPHIVSGDELITGDKREFIDKSDKEYQDYIGITEQTDKLEYKPYQTYPALGQEADKLPAIKPARNF
jgi:general secretion pathway protein D